MNGEWLPPAAFLLARMRAMRVRARAPPPLSFGLSPLSPLPSDRFPVVPLPPSGRHSVGFPGREEGELAPVGSCM